ncbi:MAG: class F420-dependent oxidoreductase [Frankiales bacterium]|jgi:F420-dependent oxidoreductase-like protein|nr:class F420-dependent oxidoreductase [Frankiales bacterium]
MDLRIFTEPQQGATYDQLLRVAKAAEDLGFDAFFRSDHYQTIGGDGGVGSTDAWVTLAGLARETSRIRLGTLITPVTFRLPGPLAISVAQVDQMSGGRVELGLGTGWYDGEHAAYGIPFPPVGERFGMLEEQLQVVRGLWTADGPFSFAGEHYQLTDSPALPKPTQSHVPIVMGGFGQKRTPRLAATYADEYNVPFHGVEDTAAAFDRVRAAAQTTGRSLGYSTAQTVAVGKDDAEAARRAEAIGQQPGSVALGGTVGQVVETLGRFAEIGATRAYLQVFDLDDLDHLELIAAEVMPQV